MEPTTSQLPDSPQVAYSSPVPQAGYVSQEQTPQGPAPPRSPAPPEGTFGGPEGSNEAQLKGIYGGTPPFSQGTYAQEETPPPPQASNEGCPEATYGGPSQGTSGPAPSQEGTPGVPEGGNAGPQTAYAPQQAYVPGPPPVYEPVVAGHGIPPPLAPGPGLPKNHPLNPNKDTKEAQHKAKIEAQKKKGFMGSIMGTLADVGNSIQRGVDSTLGYWDQAAYVRFQLLFPANASESFLGEYAATVVNGNRTVDGRIYITSHSLGFVGRFEALKFIIPLNLIGSIQPVFCTVKHEPNHVKIPTFAAANPPNRANALHIFTKDNRLHQIFSISQFEYSYGSLDYAWRAVGGGH